MAEVGAEIFNQNEDNVISENAEILELHYIQGIKDGIRLYKEFRL